MNLVHVIEVQLITGAHHFYHFQLHWSPWFCASGLEPWQKNWAPCGGSPFFSKGGEHELQKHAASFWRKVAGVDDSAWNLCRRIENYRRYSPYLDIFISWKHLLTIQDGTPVFEEERWRALAITKRCIIVLGRNWVTLSIPVQKLQSWGIINNIFYLQLRSMEEILHQLIGILSHYLQGFLHPRWCRISSINSMILQTVCSLIAKVTLQQKLPCPNVSGPSG